MEKDGKRSDNKRYCADYFGPHYRLLGGAIGNHWAPDLSGGRYLTFYGFSQFSTGQPLGQTKFKLFVAKMLYLGQGAVNSIFPGRVAWFAKRSGATTVAGRW
jgi:hypothetical protein